MYIYFFSFLRATVACTHRHLTQRQYIPMVTQEINVYPSSTIFQRNRSSTQEFGLVSLDG